MAPVQTEVRVSTSLARAAMHVTTRREDLERFTEIEYLDVGEHQDADTLAIHRTLPTDLTATV